MVVTIAVLSTLKRSASEPVLTGHRHTPHEVAAGDIGVAALAGRASPSERTGIPATAATSLRIMVIPLRSGDASAPILAVSSRLVRLSAQLRGRAYQTGPPTTRGTTHPKFGHRIRSIGLSVGGRSRDGVSSTRKRP